MEHKFSSEYLIEELGYSHKASINLRKCLRKKISNVPFWILFLLGKITTPKSKRREIFIRKLIVKIYLQKKFLEFRKIAISDLLAEKRELIEINSNLLIEKQKLENHIDIAKNLKKSGSPSS